MCYNRTAKDLSVLKPGDTVTTKPEGLTRGQKWRKGVIFQSHPFRSNNVEEDSKLLRRNCVHLKPSGKPPNLEKTQAALNPKASNKGKETDSEHSK